MGTKRPGRSTFNPAPNISMSDPNKLHPGGKISRDPSPRPASTAQTVRGREGSSEDEWRRDRDVDRSRDKEPRHKESLEPPRDRYHDRDRRPKRQDGEHQEIRNVRPLSNIEKENEKEGDRGLRKGDTFPRRDRNHGPILLAMEAERAESTERRRKKEDRDRDRDRDRARDRPKGREDHRSKDKDHVRGPRDERERDRHYKTETRRREGDNRRDGYGTRKNEKQRDDRGRDQPRMSSPERRRHRDMDLDRTERREGRRDTRSEGEIDERQRKRERVRDKEENHQQSRSEGETRSKTGDRDRREHQDQERHREKEDRHRFREDRSKDSGDNERTARDRGEERPRERSEDEWRRKEIYRHEDEEETKRKHRPREQDSQKPKGPAPKVPPRGVPRAQSSGEWSSDMDGDAKGQAERTERERQAEIKKERKLWLEPKRDPTRRDTALAGEDSQKRQKQIIEGEETVEMNVDGDLEHSNEKDRPGNSVDSEENTEDSEEVSERVVYGEDGFLTASSDEKEDDFKDCREHWPRERDTEDTPEEEDINSFTGFGTIKRDSQTDRLLLQWRGQAPNDEDTRRPSPVPRNPYADVPVQVPYDHIQSTLERRKPGAMTPKEEEEAIRIRMSGTWSTDEETKRHSQANHIKWAKNVVREILGQSEEKIDNPEPEKSEAEEQNAKLSQINDEDGKSAEEDELEEDEDEKSVELEGLRGNATGQAGMHAGLGTAMHDVARTHTHTLVVTPEDQDEEGNVSEDEDQLPNTEKTDNDAEVELYLAVSNKLYKPNSCPSLNYDQDVPRTEGPVVIVSCPEEEQEEQEEQEDEEGEESEEDGEEQEAEEEQEEVEDAEEGEEDGEEDDSGEAEDAEKEVFEEKVVQKNEVDGVRERSGAVLVSSCSFRDQGSEARVRRRGIRKTTQRRKEDTVKEEEEENEEKEVQDVGRDRRTRIFSTSDEEGGRSKSWGELDIRSVLDTIGKRKRNSKFFNAAQLYQQYSEAAQNFEILRQARSDVVSICEDSSPASSPPPARRPLPPLPQVPHPRSLSSVQSLPLPQPPCASRSGRRASSPRLSVSLGQSSTLWRDLPEVKNSPESQELSEDHRKLQEVRFEVVTSEASYCRSLDIVVDHFVKSKPLGALLTTQDRNWLFSRLADVRAISHSFLSKLEEKVDSDVLHFSVCDVIARHCQRFKMVYVPYLTNQSYQDGTYQRLMNENPGFRRIVEKLERSVVCQRLPLRSFLVLPFQRITRIKLLVQNIVKRTAPGTPEATQAIKALRLLEKLIQEGNDSITQMKSIESLVSLSAKVDFECKTLPLISQSRRLVREGIVTELRDFTQKETERSLYLHLFNDYLLLSQQKEGGRFTVIDTSPVSELRAENCRVKLHSLQKNLFRLHMSRKALLLRTDTQSDKLRWISALSRPHSEVDFSAAQDFPQMQCIRAIVAQQPDELSLEKADIILVHQQSSDHWVEGTRLSDRHRGWIPESHLDTISNYEIRKRNLSDALKLTTATAQV